MFDAYTISQRFLNRYGGINMKKFGSFFGIITMINDFMTGTGVTYSSNSI